MHFDYLIGKSFPPAMRYGAYLVLAVALYNLLFTPIIALLIALAAAFVAFADTRFRVDAEQMRYQSHNSFLGLRLGTWHSLKGFTELCILKSTLKTQAYSRTLQTAETSSDEYYNVYFLTKNHRNKILAGRFHNLEEARSAADDLSKALNWELVNYQPRLSAKSQSRRYR